MVRALPPSLPIIRITSVVMELFEEVCRRFESADINRDLKGSRDMIITMESSEVLLKKVLK